MLLSTPSGVRHLSTSDAPVAACCTSFRVLCRRLASRSLFQATTSQLLPRKLPYIAIATFLDFNIECVEQRITSINCDITTAGLML
jgi:hypothetical protein